MTARRPPQIQKFEAPKLVSQNVRERTLSEVADWIAEQTVGDPVDDVEEHVNSLLLYVARQIRSDRMS